MNRRCGVMCRQFGATKKFPGNPDRFSRHLKSIAFWLRYAMNLLIVVCALALLHVCSASYSSVPKASEEKILKVVFKLLKVDADAEQCVSGKCA